MTMRVSVKNEDPQRTAEVLVEEYRVGDRIAGPKSVTSTSIAPGESRDFYLHAAKRLIVTENPNAARAAPQESTEP